jgi:hypothetical protein
MQIDNLREKNNGLEIQLSNQEIDAQKSIKELEDRLSQEENALSQLLEKNQDLDSQKHSMMQETENIYKQKMAKLESDIEAQQQKQHNEISTI